MKNENELTFKNAKDQYFTGNYNQAINILKSIEEKIKNSSASYLIALSYLKQNEFSSSTRYLHKVITKDDIPFYTMQANMLLGYIYAKSSEYSKAEDHLHKLLQLNYENAQIYAILGYIYNKRKDFSQSEYYYQKALALEPDNANSHNGLGYNYLEWNNNLENAFKHIQKAVEIDSDNFAYLDSLGWFHFIKRSFSKALFYLTKSLRLRKHKITEHHLNEVKKVTK